MRCAGSTTQMCYRNMVSLLQTPHYMYQPFYKSE
jgi:hypothetical protein